MKVYSLNRPLPADLSVQDALKSYLDENGFTTEEYDLDSVKVTFWGWTFSIANPPSRKLAIRFHDLHHLVTGYGTDPIGEAEISAWELSKGIRVFGIYVQAIIFMGTLLGLIHSPKRVWAAWNRSKGSAQLPLPSLDHYEYLLTLTLKELRELYNVPLEGIAGRRVLNDNAPPRPEGIDD